MNAAIKWSDVIYMDTFTIQIAGLSAQVRPSFYSTREYCRSFLTDLEADLFIEISEEDLALEQVMLDREAMEEGLRFRKFTDPFLERASIQRKIAMELLNRDTILLHGSTVGLNGSAYLFTAPCGTGKSTHTRFWREVFSDRAIMVNDDKTFLQITSSGVMAYGSPWCGKHGLGSNICLPLKGICFLRRGTENHIRRAKAEEYISELWHQCFIPEDPEGHRKAIALLDQMANLVPLWEMDCTKDPQAAIISHGAMSCGS